MKFLLILVLVAVAAARPEDDYSRYDNFDVDEVINNLRLLKGYIQCFLAQGPCTAEGNDIKKWIPEGIQTSCEKCSPKQKTLVAKVIKACMDKMPEEWQKLNQLHNPEGKHDASLKEFVSKYNN